MVSAAAVASVFGLTAGGVAAAVLTVVINLAIAFVLGKILAPDFDNDARNTKGLQTTIRSNIAPRRVAYGESMTGGPYAVLNTVGTTNQILQMVILITGHPIEDVLGVIIEDEYIDISGSGGATNDSGNALDANYKLRDTKFGYNRTDPTDQNPNNSLVQIIKNNGWGFADTKYVTDYLNDQDTLDDRARAILIADNLDKAGTGEGKLRNWNVPTIASGDRDPVTGLYPSGYKLTNCAHVYLAFGYDPDVWSGYPSVKFHIKGKRLYNPALDSDLASEGADSAGTHILADPDTYEWSSNWGNCVLDYLLNKAYGLAAKVEPAEILKEIDWSEAIQASLDSDDSITNGYDSPNNGVAPRYTINGIFEVSSTPISIVESLLTSGAGNLVYSQGEYKIRAGKYREPNLSTDIINEDMIVSPLQIRTHTPRGELFNKAAGVYVPAGYDSSAPILSSSTIAKGFNVPSFEPADFSMVSPLDSSGINPYEVIDEEEIIRDFDYPFTIHNFEAQRLARIQLERVRRGITVNFESDLKMLKFSVGDTVYLEILSNSKYANENFFNRLGFDDDVQIQDSPLISPYYKQFKIIDMQYTEQFTIAVTMMEEAKEIYDWNEGYASVDESEIVSNIPGASPTAVILPPTFLVDSPNVAISEDVATTSGTTVTTLVKWNAPEKSSPDAESIDRDNISSYRLEYGQVSDPSNPVTELRVAEWITAGTVIAKPSLLLQGPIALETLYKDGIEYDFRIRAVIYSGRASAWAYYSDELGIDYDPSPAPSSGTTVYYIQPTNGTAIKNGTGTLTVEAHNIVGGVDSIISAGTIQLYVGTTLVDTNSPGNYPSPSDGYTGTFGTADINGSVVVELKDGPSGDILDTISLVDIDDGGTGVNGYIEVENGIAWIRAIDGGAWAPVQATTDLDCTFVQNGLEVARVAQRVTLNTVNGTLTAAPVTHKAGTDLNSSRVTPVISGSGTAAITVTFDYLLSPDVSSVTETVTSSLGANSGISVYLSDDGINLTADAFGENYTLPVGTISQFYVYDGPTNVTDTSDVTFAVIGAQPQNLLTGIISDSIGTKGEISLTEDSPGWSTSSELFLLRATYNTIEYDKVFSVHKLLKGEIGISGADADRYYISPINGTAIKNGTGTLTVEAHGIIAGVDNILSSGTIKLHDPSNNEVTSANGYVSPSDGYTGILDTGDINGSKVITLKDGISGQVLDTITLVDVDDGLAGDDAFYGYIEASDGLAWTQAINGGAWNPATTTTQLDFTVVQGGVVVAQDAYLITRSAGGLLTGGAATHATSPGDFADSPGIVNISVFGSASQAITVEFVYTNGSDGITVAETLLTSIGGTDGADGADANLYYISPINGTAIKNGTGTLTIEGHSIIAGVDSILSSGTIKLHDPSNNEVTTANGYVSPSDGFTGILDTGDINGSKVITLKDGISGQSLDTITLVDIDDGLAGDDAIYAYIEGTNGLAWTSLSTTGPWDPAATFTNLDVTFVQSGIVIGQLSRRIDRDGDGLLSDGGVATHSTSPGNFVNSPDTIDVIVSSDTRVKTVTYTGNFSSGSITISETVLAARGGDDGATGATGADGLTGWTSDLVFSATDADTVAWTGGTITTASGTTFPIDSPGADTGNMVARTYIYYDGSSPVGTTLSTTTTAATAVGADKILIAVAENTTDDEAFFQVFGGYGGILITGNEVVANSITANQINASFYNGAVFTGGVFQTRLPLSSSPYDTEPRAVIQSTDPQLALYSNIDNVDTLIFGVTEIEVGSPASGEFAAEVTIVGDFTTGSLDTAQMYSAAGIIDLRGRLGVTLPGSATGGIATLTAVPQTLTTTTADYELDVDLYTTGLAENTLSFTIQDHAFTENSSSPPVYTVPVWDLDWYYSDTGAFAGEEVPVPGGGFQITGTTSDFQENPPLWYHSMNLSASRNVMWTPASPFADTDPIYFMIRVVKISGSANIPRLTACIASESISGGGGTDTFAGLTDTNITSPAIGAGLYWDGTYWVDLDAGASGEVLTGNGITSAPSWQAGGGDVTAGTQADNELAVWNATAKQIEGDTDLRWDGTRLDIRTGNELRVRGANNVEWVDILQLSSSAHIGTSKTSPGGATPLFVNISIDGAAFDGDPGGNRVFRFNDEWNTSYLPLFIEEQTTPAANATGFGQIYVKDVTSGTVKAELHYQDDLGTDIQITDNGALAGVIADGTVTHATLRWDGSAWIEDVDARLDATGSLFLEEKADASVELTATMGQFWVDNTNPNVPMYTDGDGLDMRLDVITRNNVEQLRPGGFNGVSEMASAGNTDAELREILFTHQDGTSRGAVGHFGGTPDGSAFNLANDIASGHINMYGRDNTDAIQRLMCNMDPDAGVTLYYDGTPEFYTWDNTQTGQTTGALVKAHDGDFHDVGFNTLPRSADSNTATTLKAQECGHVWDKTSSTARTVTLAANTDLDFPVDGFCTLQNKHASNNITVTEGASTTLYYMEPGVGRTDTFGGCTIGPGGTAYIRRASSTSYDIWGWGITP